MSKRLGGIYSYLIKTAAQQRITAGERFKTIRGTKIGLGFPCLRLDSRGTRTINTTL